MYEHEEGNREALAAAAQGAKDMTSPNRSILLTNPQSVSQVATLSGDLTLLKSAERSKKTIVVSSIVGVVLLILLFVVIRKPSPPPGAQAKTPEARESAKPEPPEQAYSTNTNVENPTPRVYRETRRMARKPEISQAAELRSDPKNWQENKVPGGTDNVLLEKGARAQVRKASKDPFTGSLMLKDSAVVQIFSPQTYFAIPQGDSKLVMHRASKVFLHHPSMMSFGLIEVKEDAHIHSGFKKSIGNNIRRFAKPISGTGRLLLIGTESSKFVFEAKSTLSGVVEARAVEGQRSDLIAGSNGCFGTCKVVIGDRCSLRIRKAMEDIVSDRAELVLQGKPGTIASKLDFNSHETVGAFTINGAKQSDGVYDAKTHPNLIGGKGKLTVQSAK